MRDNLDRLMWQPSAERIASSNMARFMRHAATEAGAPAGRFRDHYEWSVREPARFWSAVWDFCDVRGERGSDRVLEHPQRMPGAQWFPDARLNFAENLLRYADDRPALVFRDEAGARETISYAQLQCEVARVAAGLRACGVVSGDRVAGLVANRPEAVIAMLATTSLGAIWSSCSPDFGVNGIRDRFGQIEPKILFATDGYHYNGKRIDSAARIEGLAGELQGLQRVVVIPYLGRGHVVDALDNACLFADFGEPDAALAFEQLPFDHPVYIVYSSGTTGVPKCIVHGAGGTLLQHLKEHQLHADITREDRLFYFTTCGWMMWNWLVSGLASGATVVLFDGSPMHPAEDALWQLAEEEDVTVFGTSAKYLSALEKAGVRPRERFELTRLGTILSTGSPLAPEGFDYVYRDIKSDVQLSSISGGTDILSCFALGNPVLPVYRGELQCRGLGMDVEVFDDRGQPARGEKGELVCRRPFPSMPIGFWNDPDGERYRAAYFARFDDIWCHGDYAEITEHDGLVIYGRSDAVLNPGGVRIGTAEIYRQVEKLDEIVESIAVGQEWQDDVRVILFVRMRDGAVLDDALERRLRSSIRTGASPRHVPARILAVPDIPRTLSGKIVELAVRDVIHGRPVRNTDALANPGALAHFQDRPELSR